MTKQESRYVTTYVLFLLFLLEINHKKKQTICKTKVSHKDCTKLIKYCNNL